MDAAEEQQVFAAFASECELFERNALMDGGDVIEPRMAVGVAD
jgi:hypothetical protein